MPEFDSHRYIGPAFQAGTTSWEVVRCSKSFKLGGPYHNIILMPQVLRGVPDLKIIEGLKSQVERGRE